MSILTREFYAVACDWTGCVALADGGADSAYWWDEGQAIDTAVYSDWLVGDQTGPDYCPQHTGQDENGELQRITWDAWLDALLQRIPESIESVLYQADLKIRRLDRLSRAEYARLQAEVSEP